MKKIMISLVLCLAMVGLIAAPAMAAPPKPTFTTGLLDGTTPLIGTLASGFALVTGGGAYPGTPMHVLTLNNPIATPPLKDGMYAFFLKAKATQQTKLITYFATKGWPSNYYAQIVSEIKGISPFFYLTAAGGVYSLVDGFKWALGLGPGDPSNPYPLTIDDDYPIGTYLYKGLLKSNTNSPLQVNLTLIVTR
jgi:hypothetical protein